MRFINTSNGYIEFVEQINDSIVNSSCFPISSVYCRLTNGTKLTFYLGNSNEPYKKQIFDLDFPISLNGEFYQNYADIQETLGELFGEPNKQLKEKVEEIDSNLNVALTNLENNTEDIETLQGQMESKADLSEVYTQEKIDLLLNLKVDNSTLQNQYYDKNATDAKLGLKADKADTYTKTDVNNLLDTKASKDEVDLLETEVDSINDDLLLKANKADVYTKTQTDNLLGEKANINSVYNKSEVDIKLDEKADKLNTYTKTEADNLLAEKADKSNTYTKTEVNGLLDEKADKTQLEDLDNNISQVSQEVNTLTERVSSKADKEWAETEVSSLWSSISNHQVQINERAYASDLDGKQDTLVNQENIKSIQNQDILGWGNIELFKMMNQADYDMLVETGEVDNSKLYLIPDSKRLYFQGTLIIDGSATPTPTPTGETEVMVTFYTEDAGEMFSVAQLRGTAPYTITKQAVMDCLDEGGLGIDAIAKIELSDGVHRIDDEAFSGFTSLREVQYGTNLKEMGSSAFTHCTSLTNLVIPDSVTGETDFTFTECSNATTCYVGTGITTLGGDTFCDCENLTSCHIPSNVTNLGSEHGGVFARCYSLTSVTVDGQIDHIGSNTFLDTNSLTELWLTGCTNVPLVESDTFVLEDASRVTVHIPCDMTDSYQMTPFLDIFTDHYVEEGCGEPTGTLCMTLQSDVANTNIYQNDGETLKQALDRYLGDTFGYDDFDAQHCNEFKSSITHVSFSNNITQIESTNVGLFGYGTDAGYGQYDGYWNNIESVTLPSNLQTIGNYVFQIMPKVSQWNIPSTVTSIGNAAFERRTQDPNVNRVIRFNSNSCPTLGNSSFDIVDEEEMMVGADTNQTFKVNCGYLSEYSSAFNNMGGSYETYSVNELITEDCDEPEPTGETETHVIFYDENGDEIASLEGLSPYNITQSAVEGLGESVKENCRKVLFGYNVKSIGEKAFVGFDKVNEWTIQNRDTTEIGNFAFARTDNSTVRTFIFTNAVTPLNTETLGNNVFDRTKEGIISLAADENTYFKVNGCDALFNLNETLENKDGYYSQYIERVSNLIDEECH